MDSAPKLDGNGNDPQWKKAKILKVIAVDGPEIFLQSVYTNDELFFFIQWEDSTKSIRPDQWVFDGAKWSVLKELRWEDEDPWDADNDMLGFQWPVNDSIKGFDEKGCRKICHAPEKEDKMYTNNLDEKTDIWLWKAGLTNPLGYADSYYLDNTNILISDEEDKNKRINAAHKGDDPGPMGLGFARNLLNGKPGWIPRGGPDKNLFLIKGNETTLEQSKIKKGDTIPGWLLARPNGSRGNINAKGKYYKPEYKQENVPVTLKVSGTKQSKWVLEMGRKLFTDDKKHDVQFTDLKKVFYFGLAVWDNEKLLGHTRVKKPIGLMFE